MSNFKCNRRGFVLSVTVITEKDKTHFQVVVGAIMCICDTGRPEKVLKYVTISV